jgi:hypothetical protein
MKKLLLLTLFAFPLMCSAQTKATATVDRSDGLYIFVMSLPETPYTSLGTVKKGMAWTGAPSEMLADQVKKVKKQYPEAEAIIFNIDMDKAEAIKFK